MNLHGAIGGQKRALGAPELELHVVMSHHVWLWLLRIKLGSSVRAVAPLTAALFF